MKRKSVFLLMLLLVLSICTYGGAQSAAPDAVDKENTGKLYLGQDKMTDFEVDEFGQILLAGIVPDGWTGKNLNDPITGDEFYDLWRTFTMETLGFPESNLDNNCWDWIRGTVAGKENVERPSPS
jgi:hypothetical protein